MAWSFFGSSSSKGTELPKLFLLPVEQGAFINIDVKSIFQKILTDVSERAHGLSEDQKNTLWDSCLKSEHAEGLITMLAEAMTNQTDLYLVYDKTVNVLRKADFKEQQQIKEDYKKEAKSSIGVYISFAKFDKIKLIRLYSALTYCVAGALNKGMNISMALQIAIKNLRSSVGLIDAEKAEAQAKDMAKAMEEGRGVLMDVEDAIRNSMPDLTSVEKAMQFINEKLSFYLGLPASYIMGEQTTGISSTGEADTKAVERGLKNYYESIFKPVVFALFGVKTKYKSQDFRQLSSALEALKTFELVSDTYLGPASKKKIMQSILDLDDDDIKEDEKEVAQALKDAKDVTPPGTQEPPQNDDQENE